MVHPQLMYTTWYGVLPSIQYASFKNDVHLRKPFCCCSTFPLQTQLGRRKRSPGRSVSEASPCFGNLCVYEPSTLRKEPSASSEESFNSRKKPSNLQKKPSDLQHELHCKRILEKHSKCRRHFFFDVYRSLGNSGQWEDLTPPSSEFLCKIYESVSALW